MSKVNNHNTFLKFREEFPFFVFDSFSVQRTKKSLQISYHFDLAGKFSFHPTLAFESRDFYDFDTLDDDTIQNLAFHIGMVELISYWKSACPPKVIVRPFKLDNEQVNWWKKLYFHGLGEFFYLNTIQTDMESFMEIDSQGDPVKISTVALSEKNVVVPVGGGKDSIVTLEMLKDSNFRIYPFVVNPREATNRTVTVAGYGTTDSMVVKRKLDDQLLQLNKKGFLNGHTPFSSLLAFVSVFSALATGSKYIALSNESSANESTVPDSMINHQYSKSFEFEQDFSTYIKRYVNRDIAYFSFLRPLNELQIGALFTKFPQHFAGFRSCNVGSKTDSWCGHCPKCLFTWIILSPFLHPEKLTSIFGKDLMNDPSLKPVFDELSGNVSVKPFECVGTPEEVSAAVGKGLSLYPSGKKPELLQNFHVPVNAEQQFNALLSQWNHEHHLPESFLQILTSKWNEAKA